VLPDSADEKWVYRDHTSAKHAVVSRYLKAWLSIFGNTARRQGRRSELVGRYIGGEPGSPLIFRDIAGQVTADGKVDEVELFFIERDRGNYEQLKVELSAAPPLAGVTERPPALTTFVAAAQRILDHHLSRRPRPSFWFIDPFGFRGILLAMVRDILSRPRAEVFITFMLRDLNRFWDNPNHMTAASELLGLEGADLQDAAEQVLTSPTRGLALRDLYVKRLHDGAGAGYVWPFRVASRGEHDTVYYLMHASNHIRAFQVMKDTTYYVGGWHHAFLGRDDFAVTGQAELPFFETDLRELKEQLLRTFSGQDIEYVELLRVAYPDPRFHMWIAKHFREALVELVAEERIHKTPVDTRGKRGLRDHDRLRFPPSTQLGL
jgi:three-Cys-motif partner protein